MKWSTKSGHRVKAVTCHDEVNDDKRKENSPGLRRSVQTRGGDAGDGAGLQDVRASGDDILEGTTRSTTVYAKREGGWQLVSQHQSLMTK